MDPISRIKVFEESMSYLGNTMGFSRYRRFSDRKYAVFTRNVTDRWSMSLRLEDSGVLSITRGHGSADLIMIIHNNDWSGDGESREQDLLIYKVTSFIPGFFFAYRKFYSILRLRLIVSANMALVPLIAPMVKRALDPI